MKKGLIFILLSVFYSMVYGQDSKFSVGIELRPTKISYTGSDHSIISELGVDYRSSFSAGLSLEY